LKQGGGRRERVLIFTKVGHEMGPDKKGLSRRYIRAEVEDSLKRLQIETIDLYQSHRDAIRFRWWKPFRPMPS
jgi:aryl-alcohol dehydrogenase-like predicted oxidoreductase